MRRTDRDGQTDEQTDGRTKATLTGGGITTAVYSDGSTSKRETNLVA